MYKKITPKPLLILSLLLLNMFTNSCSDKSDNLTNVMNVPITKGMGKLQFAISPSDAECVLTQKGVEKYRWKGSNDFDKIIGGKYDLTANAGKYDSYLNILEIKESQTNVVAVQMQLSKIFGKLQFTIVPDSAECLLTLNGVQKFRWTGSKMIDVIEVGSYNLVTNVTCFNPYEKVVEIKENQTTVENIKMVAKLGKLQISVSPVDAEYVLSQNGVEKYRGIGSRIVDSLFVGSYTLTTQSIGYNSLTKTIDINENQTAVENILLQSNNSGKLQISINPVEAQCVLLQNGTEKYRWTGSKTIDSIIAGNYDLKVSTSGYYELNKTIQIQWKQITIENVSLVSKPGKLQFTIDPSTAECVLTLSGVEKYRWTGAITIDSVPTGSYYLTATANGYDSFEKAIDIFRGQTNVKSFQMTKSGFVLVQGGTFTMGETGVTEPVHTVTLNSYYISKTEVTQGEYQAVMGTNPSHFTTIGSTGPVERVSWYNCISYCNKLSINEGRIPCYSLNGNTAPVDWTIGTIVCDFTKSGYRLPTEAEWEYAARGGSNSKNYTYSGSNTNGDVAWHGSNSSNITHVVGGKLANELGIVDMSGNVWEWCWDWYGAYTANAQINPTGPSAGSTRSFRGGSWVDINCHVSARLSDGGPSRILDNVGFRIARHN